MLNIPHEFCSFMTLKSRQANKYIVEIINYGTIATTL